jgi:hypothetical protein
MPILVFTFSNGASLSVGFSEGAPDESQVHRGAWLELVADDPGELKQKILQSGLRRVEYLGSEFYFQAPGIQGLLVSITQKRLPSGSARTMKSSPGSGIRGWRVAPSPSNRSTSPCWSVV